MRALTAHPLVELFRVLESRALGTAARSALQAGTGRKSNEGHTAILRLLADQGSSSIGMIAPVLGVSLATASRYALQCDEWGWVRKTRSPTDARAVNLELMPRGREVRSQWAAWWANAYSRALGPFSSTQLAAFADELRSFRIRAAAVKPELYAAVPLARADRPSGQAGGVLPAAGAPAGSMQSRGNLEAVAAEIRWLSLSLRRPAYSRLLLAELESPLTPTELLTLRGCNPTVDTKELMAVTAMEKSNISRVVGALERSGLIERRAGESGRGRIQTLRPTRAGHAKLCALEAAEVLLIDAVVRDWPSEMLEDFLGHASVLSSSFASLQRIP